MTGESELMPKKVPTSFEEKVNPFLISGSRVMEGSGQALVLAVGEHTFSER